MRNILVTFFTSSSNKHGGSGIGLIKPTVFADMGQAADYIAAHHSENVKRSAFNEQLRRTKDANTSPLGVLGIEFFATSAKPGEYKNTTEIEWGTMPRADKARLNRMVSERLAL